MEHRPRFFLIIVLVAIWVFTRITVIGKLQELYQTAIVLWLAVLVVLIADFIISEKGYKKIKNPISK